MKPSSFINSLIVSSLCIPLLAACASSHWQSSYHAGQQALAANPPKLKEAELNFKAAIADAEGNRVAAPQYAEVVIDMGELLARQERFGEAQDYLLRAVSLATATNMPAARNVHLLKLLALSYERMQKYDQAVDTDNVLMNYTATEFSPSSEEYREAVDDRSRLKRLLATANANGS